MSQLNIITDFVPIDITTAEGYNEFIQSPLCNDSSTVFPDSDSNGYVLVNNEVVATVSEEVKDSLFNYTEYPLFYNEFKQTPLQNVVPQGVPSTPKQANAELLSSPESFMTKTP